MFDLLSPLHIIVLLIVALLVFGPKRLPEIGSGLGRAIREFRGAMSGVLDENKPPIYPVSYDSAQQPDSGEEHRK
jgi:sec-independent protein translocase protein TatA